VIDVAKGLSILLVLLGHSHIFPNEVNRAFSSFRMPFFFFLSGIFFSTKGSFRLMFFLRSDSLLKPYFVTLFIAACLSNDFTGGAFGHRLIEILYGVGDSIHWPWSPLWFLPHLWLLFIVSYIFVHFRFSRENSPYWNFSVFLLLMLIAHITTKNSPEQSYLMLGGYVDVYRLPMIKAYGLPMSAEIIPVSLTFFLAGHHLKEQVKNFSPSLIVLSLCITGFILLYFFANIFVDLNHSVYRNCITAPLSAFCGIYFSLSLAYYLDKIEAAAKVIGYIGSKSLFLLLFHGFFMNWVTLAFASKSWPVSLTASVIAIVGSLLIAKIVYSSDILSLFFLPFKNNLLFQAVAAKKFFRGGNLKSYEDDE
jgi:fucose 4-O-acetylase-like acetyltransferase